ncbi:MAG: flagellin [Devosia sp.]
MTMRVATFAMNRQMLDASLTTQAKMADMQLQEASGLKSTDYGGLGSSARKLINLEVTAERSKRYEVAANDASDVLESSYSALNTVADLLSDMRVQLTSALSTDADSATGSELVTYASSTLQELTSLLNTRLGDNYIFGGSPGTTAPVDVSTVTFDLDTPDTSYYQGGSGTLSAQVSENQSISYGVNADSSAFEKALRALGSLAGSDGTLTDIDLQAMLDLVVEAVDGVASLLGGVSLAADSMDRAVETQQDLQDFYNNGISSLRDVDVVAISSQLTTYETQLQASYAALAKVQSLSLVDYLR